MSMEHRRRLVRARGRLGWASTGANMRSSTAMAKANPPVTHMPTAPTPGPPQRWCSVAARARSQETTGDVFPVAKMVNSRLMQAGMPDCAT